MIIREFSKSGPTVLPDEINNKFSSRNEIVFARSRKMRILTAGIHRRISRIYPPQAG